MVLKKIKKMAITFVVIGVVILLLFILIIVASVSEDTDITSISILALFAIGGIVCLIFGIRDLAAPTKSGIFKKNPYVLQMADELYSDIQYQDDFIVMSERLLAPKKKPENVTPMNEIFLLYVQKQSTNFIPTGKDLYVVAARGDFQINIYGKKKDKVDQTVQALANTCPNMRIGYTSENLSYANQMKQAWQMSMSNNQR